MRRFLPFVNTMTDAREEPAKDTKQNITKVEYRLTDRMEKTIECRVIQNTYKVTKGFTERKKEERVVGMAFGVDKNPEEIRNNVGVTIVQKDNIWHPYYEVKLEEEDLGTRYRKNMEQKKASAAVDGLAIEEIQQKLQQIEQTERDEKERALQKDLPQKPQKRTFDVKALFEAKKKQEEEEANVRVDDPLAVKLTSVPA